MITYKYKNADVRSFYGDFAKTQEEGGIMFVNWDDGRQKVKVVRSMLDQLTVINVEAR